MKKNSGQRDIDTYLSVREACDRFGFSRSTFYRMVNDPESDLKDLIVRIPPLTGRMKIPARRFENWLSQAQR